MPLHEFWHGDMRLLECYQKAYLRNVSYTGWLNGKYNYLAFSTVMANAFANKGTSPKNYIDWQDPIEKLAPKKELTKEQREQTFRQEQIEQQQWLNGFLKNG